MVRIPNGGVVAGKSWIGNVMRSVNRQELL